MLSKRGSADVMHPPGWGGWHFNISLPSREQQQRVTLLIPITRSVTMWNLDSSKKVTSLSSCVNEHQLATGVCLSPFPGEVEVLVRLLSFPYFSPLHPPPLTLICLAGTLMILKSACSYNASYIDRLISVFMRSLQKMVREHLSPQQANPGVTETSTGTWSWIQWNQAQPQQIHNITACFPVSFFAWLSYLTLLLGSHLSHH